MLHGAIAAALTPLRAGGSELDEEAVEPYVDFLARHGVDGILTVGTTGEGVLLSVAERERITELFFAAARGRLQVAVHCGAQTTVDTAALAEHAAQLGADAVAVIAPPYFPLDVDELLAHFEAAAGACAPLPFYAYEFAARSGYAIPPAVLERLRERAPNLAGLKVSDVPWEKVAPYLIEGLDVFIGAEALIAQGLTASKQQTAAALRHLPRRRRPARARPPRRNRPSTSARSEPRSPAARCHAASRTALRLRGVQQLSDVAEPLHGLARTERAEVERIRRRLVH